MSRIVEHEPRTEDASVPPAPRSANSTKPTTRRVWRTRALIGGTILVLGLVAVLVVWRTRRPASAPATTPSGMQRMAGMQGMSDMGGMPMASGGAVTMTAAQMRQFGVTFGTVDVRPLTAETRTTGVVTVNETRLSQVAPKFGGFVERLYVNATGQPVRRGQPLMDVYSPDLVAAQQELLLAGQLQREIGRATVSGVPGSGTDLVAAARRRLRYWDVSEAQIDDVLRTGQPRRTLTLYAPASGVIVEKRVVQGQAIQAGEMLYTIADLTDVWVDVQVREADAAAVRPGTTADLELAGLPGRTLKGRVAYIYPMLDTASRSLRARVVVANSGGLLKPGMYATVRLATPTRSALTVPTTAVLHTGDRTVVFVDMGGGRLMPQDVEIGRMAGEVTEVLAGVEPGQRVVTSAQFLLDSESNLGEVMKSMIGQMGAGDMGNMKGMSNMPGMPGMNDRGADTRGMPPMPGMPATSNVPNAPNARGTAPASKTPER